MESFYKLLTTYHLLFTAYCLLKHLLQPASSLYVLYMRFGRFRKFLLLFVILLILLGVGGTFFWRPPVLIVTDPSFINLYGTFRLTRNGILTSLLLFRRVSPVTVAESAGSDLVTLAVEGASKSPMAVFFPARYIESARIYKEGHQNIPVYVTEGRNPISKDSSGLGYIVTDSARDFYLAGVCAALFAGNGKVLFFYDGAAQNELTDAFRQGLLAEGDTANPVLINSSLDAPTYNDIGCVVVAGPAQKFLERNLKIPIILFSWADPAIVPRTVKLIFDDSPLAQVMETIKLPPEPGKEVVIPSNPILLLSKEEKKNFRNISDIIKAKF